ncbi:hypothetical protein GWK08_03515 [Leptobacterium flavescens]|uniref:Outer membrane beta-barrel protein n=1 Tax=Leptobacterium flavescens TaxID=472055 RepID=A0A6P0UGW3_9FLAO|nr:hypothetical protein [Leptobacterium flavescens]NER12495.1 hypothetical protein [Leptobacterium flavescens]
MRIIIYYIALAVIACYTSNLKAQTLFDYEAEIRLLEKEKEYIVTQEKNALKEIVIAIEKRLDRKEITEEEAKRLKAEAAKKHALNIENRIAIVDNKIALLERNKKYEVIEEYDKSGSVLKFGNLFEINSNGYKKRKYKYDRRTTSDLVLAVGFNNTIQDGVSINDSDYRFGGSRFLELGWAWKTRVFKNTNFLRLKYGFSFQTNNLKPTGNRIFVDENGQTTLEDFDFDLDKSKLRITNLVVPVHFEFGPSRKWEREDYVRYSTRRHFKIGIGGYGGFNIGSRQKLKYRNNGERVKEKIKGDFNINNLVYGLSAYLGWGSTGLYAKYDLNPLFNDDQPEQRNISLGLRFDLD